MSLLQIADRVRRTEENVWIEFSELRARYKPLNLGQGCADFDAAPPRALQTLAQIAVQTDEPLLNQYTRAFGHPRLVRILSKLYSQLVGRTIDAQKEILVTYGASAAIYCAVMALVNPGDEVIIIEPYFDLYLPVVEYAGGIPIFVPLRPKGAKGKPMLSSDWKLDEQELENCFSTKTKMIIINTPNNPLGKVFSLSELEFIGGLAQKHNVLILMDEVYEMITYSGLPHIRMASMPGMWERTITISSAGKIFSLTGWRLGWVYGPENLLRPVQLMNNIMASSCPTPIQEAVAIVLEEETEHLGQAGSYWTGLATLLESKRDRLAALLSDAGMEPIVPQGSFFILANITGIESLVNIEKETGGERTKDYRFARWLTKEKGLQGIPLSSFYSAQHCHLAENFIRFCFMKDDKTLKKAEDLLSALKSSLIRSQGK